jgi:hypothetical protein
MTGEFCLRFRLPSKSQGSFYMPQSCDMGHTALLPLRRKAWCGTFRPKHPTASAGFETAILGTRGQHANRYTTEAARGRRLHQEFFGGIQQIQLKTEGREYGDLGTVPPSQGFRSNSKWVKPVFWLGCYGCIFHGTGNSVQLCQHLGISGEGMNPQTPSVRRCFWGPNRAAYCWVINSLSQHKHLPDNTEIYPFKTRPHDRHRRLLTMGDKPICEKDQQDVLFSLI